MIVCCGGSAALEQHQTRIRLERYEIRAGGRAEAMSDPDPTNNQRKLHVKAG